MFYGHFYILFLCRQVRHATPSPPQERIERQRRKKICRIIKWGHHLHIIIIKGSDHWTERKRIFQIENINGQQSICILKPQLFIVQLLKPFFLFSSNRIGSHYFIVSKKLTIHIGKLIVSIPSWAVFFCIFSGLCCLSH